MDSSQSLPSESPMKSYLGTYDAEEALKMVHAMGLMSQGLREFSENVAEFGGAILENDIDRVRVCHKKILKNFKELESLRSVFMLHVLPESTE